MKLAVGALTGLFRLPPSVLRRLAGAPMRVDGQQLDVQNQLLLRISSIIDGTPIEDRTVAAARRMVDESVIYDPPLPAGVTVRDRTMSHGAQARVYTPHDAVPNGRALVFFHGGGWVIGSRKTCGALCAQLAAQSAMVVVSVDYRLAPEHVFPAAADDALLAFDWVKSAHTQLGIDPSRIGVGGDSAGGNLAAVVAQQRRGEVGYQLLIYPVTDVQREAPSYALFQKDLLLTSGGVRWFSNHYTPDASVRADPRVSPLLAESLEGVAPACVVVVGFDPLRDEGLAYAQRLKDVGALDLLLEEPSLSHSCMSMLRFVERARYLVTRAARRLQHAL